MTDQAPSKPFEPAEYWEQRLATRYSLGSTGWISLGDRFNEWSYAVRKLVFKRLGRQALRGRPAPRVLDVGSGTGFYLELWQSLGVRQLEGSDLTSVAVERLRSKFPDAKIEQVDVGEAELPLQEASYDAISIIDVLYHVVDDGRYARAFRNLARLLKPDGTLIFSENLPLAEQRAEHQVSRTAEQLDRVLADAGLQIVRRRPVFFLMNTPISSRSRLLHRWWRHVRDLVGRREAFGWAFGAALFPVEAALGRLLRDGPSTKMFAAKRI